MSSVLIVDEFCPSCPISRIMELSTFRIAQNGMFDNLEAKKYKREKGKAETPLVGEPPRGRIKSVRRGNGSGTDLQVWPGGGHPAH
jgi:hypothetical protein